MKLSESLDVLDESGDVGKAIRGYAKRAKRLEDALEKIERWYGEFPPTGNFYDLEKTKPTTYVFEHGIDECIEYMREIARESLDDPSKYEYYPIPNESIPNESIPNESIPNDPIDIE